MENRLAVEVEGLTKVFGSTLALDAVDLRAARGEVVALLGPNGAGKTTLLKLLSTALKPTAGGGRILGEDLVKGRDSFRRRIGMISHNHYPYEELTAEENLRFAATMRGIRPERDRIRKALADVGLEAQGRREGPDVKHWDEAPAGDRKDAPVRPGAAVPRRAAQHAGPGRHRAAQRLCGVGAGPRRVGHRGDVRSGARRAKLKAELGMLLDLTATVSGRVSLHEQTRGLSDRRRRVPRYLPEPASEFERRLADKRTPPAARRWGFWMNVSEASVRELVRKHVA